MGLDKEIAGESLLGQGRLKSQPFTSCFDLDAFVDAALAVIQSPLMPFRLKSMFLLGREGSKSASKEIGNGEQYANKDFQSDARSGVTTRLLLWWFLRIGATDSR